VLERVRLLLGQLVASLLAERVRLRDDRPIGTALVFLLNLIHSALPFSENELN
jgi:hypothetical protein